MDEACLPDAFAETDEGGTAVFDALEPGLYLLSGQSVCVDRQIYTPSPLLIVCLAEREAEPELTRSPEKADYSVQIVWDDEKTPEQRPESLPQSEEENVPENENRGWLAIPALMLLAAAGIFLRKPRKNQKKLDCKPA